MDKDEQRGRDKKRDKRISINKLTVSVCVRERQTDRDRERKTDRQRQREKDRQTET